MTDDILVATIRKNSREEIRVSLGEYQGHTVAHARVWFKAADGTMRPSRSGLAFRVDLLPEIARALSEANDHAESLGLVAPAPR
ncbi:MAG TPA: PC4/YdbC family ssDNA-binding protein [Microvirga sp.]|nr:PC4/YdbC family ssDNA-binding protein [Microvirga sp.]